MARGIDTIANRITLEGGAEILKFLDSMGKEGEQAAQKLRGAFAKSGFDKSTKSAEAGVGRLRTAFRGLDRDISGAVGKFNPLRTALTGIQGLAGGLFRGLGAGALGGAGVGAIAAGLLALSKSAAETAANLKDQAEAFDLNTDSLQEFQSVAGMAGLNQDKLSRFFGAFINQIDTAGDSAKKAGKDVDQANKSFQKIKVPSLDGAGDVFVTVRRGVQETAKAVDATDRVMEVFGDTTLTTEEKIREFAKRLFEVESPIKRAQILLKSGLAKRGDIDDTADFLQRLSDGSKDADAALAGLVKGLDKAQIAAGDKTNDAFNRLSLNLERTRNRLGIAFDAGPAVDVMNSALVRLNSSLEGVEATAARANETLDGSKSAFQAITDLIFGQQTNTGEGGQSASNPISAAIAQASLDIDAFFAKVKDESAAAQIAEPLSQAFRDAWARIEAETPGSVGTAINAIKGAFAPAAFVESGAAIASGINAAWPSIVAAAKSAAATVQGIIDGIISAINQAISRLASARQSKGSNSSDPGFSFTGLAGGGRVLGPGGPREDRVPIWASNGEFMVQTKAARKVGYGFLRLLNSGRYSLADLFERLNAGRYRDGGIIAALERSFPAPRMAFADGGEIDAPAGAGLRRQEIVFQLPGGQKITGFTATEGAVAQLKRFAVHSKQFAAGRKPRYYGK